MAQTCANIILGPARLFYAPVGESLPPVTTKAYGIATWGGNWVEVGFTGAPIALNVSYDVSEATAEQVMAPIKRRRTNEAVSIETTLAEITATNLSLGTQGTVTNVVAATTAYGYEQLDLTSSFQMTERAWGIEGLYEASSGTDYPVRIFLYRATSMMNGALEFAKETQSGIPLQIQSLYDCDNAKLLTFQRVEADQA